MFQIYKLDARKYDTWCVQMKCILVHSDLLTITNGTYVKPVATNEAEHSS